jgi:hypothetical protein
MMEPWKKRVTCGGAPAAGRVSSQRIDAPRGGKDGAGARTAAGSGGSGARGGGAGSGVRAHLGQALAARNELVDVRRVVRRNLSCRRPRREQHVASHDAAVPPFGLGRRWARRGRGRVGWGAPRQSVTWASARASPTRKIKLSSVPCSAAWCSAVLRPAPRPPRHTRPAAEAAATAEQRKERRAGRCGAGLPSASRVSTLAR